MSNAEPVRYCLDILLTGLINPKTRHPESRLLRERVKGPKLGQHYLFCPEKFYERLDSIGNSCLSF